MPGPSRRGGAILFTPDERRAILAVVGLFSLGLVVRLVRPGSLPPEGGSDSLLVVIARETETGTAGSTPPPGLAEDGRIRVNLASEADLVRLPGIGPALARRILDSRRNRGSFESIEDLRRVKGIGPKIAARLEPLVSFATDSTAPTASRREAVPGDPAPEADRNGELHHATRGSQHESLNGSEP